MELGIEKYAMLIMKISKRETTEWTELPNRGKIKTLGENENYKFLRILDVDPIYPTPPLGQDMTQGQFLSGV